jgi:ribosomal protein S18 acetylase RimI-like enzyme
VRHLIFAYADELTRTASIDLEQEGFTQGMKHFPDPFAPPNGALILAQDGNVPVGCVGLRAMEDGAGEIKRLYVVPDYRGEGVGIKLLMGVINAAHMRGMRSLCLDTLPHMGHAIALYERLGFSEIGPYYISPHPGTRYFRLPLIKT